MKVSLSWLKEYVSIKMSETELANALTMIGLEVEAITDRFSDLTPIIVGKILSAEPHPNAERLSICQVDVGNTILSIVCGAPNAVPEKLVPVAPPGTVLPSGLEVKKTIIRGQYSEGMLCSELELGLGSDGSGLLILPEKTTIGASFIKKMGISDPVFEIGLTPNRPDCLSVIGIAREVAAIQKEYLLYPETSFVDSGNPISAQASVTIAAPDLCPRYAARIVENISIAPSPFWLQDRLISIGLRPINNIVDVTNFVMMEMGQPLHAFDFDHLAEHRIVVRTASEGEKFITLDQKERSLSSDMLMICDGKKPVAIAGVMGGLNSEIEPVTKRVLIESAYFNPVSIRKTAKRLGLSTDSSYRFERGVDPEITVKALNRAARLMAEIAGGVIVNGYIDENPNPFIRKSFDLSVSVTNRLLGIQIQQKQMAELLTTIEMDIAEPPSDPDIIKISPPSYRVDIGRPEDFMEEIARLYGYDNIPVSLPAMPAQTLRLPGSSGLRILIRQLMTGLGFSEAVNYSFVPSLSCDYLNLNADDPKRHTVSILNPLSEDQTQMRSSLIPGLLETMHRNNSKQNKDIKLFEIGQTFYATDPDCLPKEIEMVAGLWTGFRSPATWYQSPALCDFFDLKGVVETLLFSLNLSDILFTQLSESDCTYLRSGHSARIFSADVLIGVIGEINPSVLKNYGLKQQAFIFELELEKISHLMPDRKGFASISKFPSISRDITLIVDQAIESGQVFYQINKNSEKLVETVNLIDVFTGNPIADGKKSLSFRITYRSGTETLSDEAVNFIHHRIAEKLIQTFNAELPI